MMTATSSSFKKQSLLIIIIALCIHGGLGIVLFLLEPLHNSLYSQEAQVILVDNQARTTSQQKLNKPPHTTLVPEKEEWGLLLPEELLMLAERPAMAKKMPPTTTAVIAKQKPALEKPTLVKASGEKPTDKSMTKAESLSSETTIQTVQKQHSIAMMTTESPSLIKITSATTNKKLDSSLKEKSFNTTQQQHNSVSQKKLSLASLGKGFLEQLPKASYGRGFMPGNQRAKMTATQIAIEEYTARFEKIVYPLFRTICREVPPSKSVTNAPGFNFNVSPEGKLIDFYIDRSSGDPDYDRQFLAKLKESNLWGVPMPESIRKALSEKQAMIILN